MFIRHSTNEDIESMLAIFHQAQAYFKGQGIDQWQDGYPNVEQLSLDIKKENSYVLIDDDKIIGTMYFAIEDDSTYHYIEGKWLTNETPYAVIHRIVVDENIKGQGIAKILLEYAQEQCRIFNVPSIRIDTHDDNLSMQRFLTKNGFQSCGHIYIASGALRIAFEKILE